MIEFTAWEVYAYEEGNRPSSALDEGQTNGRPSSKPECQPDRHVMHGNNRIDQVVLAEHLPQISDKALSFESYHIHAEKGIFGGRHDGAIMHWPISQTPSVTVPYANMLRGHTGSVLTLDFALDLGPEGLLFSGSADRSIKEGQEFFVAGFFSGQIIMWSFAKKSVVCSFRAHTDTVCSMAVHGCFLFSGSDDTQLRMWNMFNLPETYELGVLRHPSSPSSSGSGSPIVCVDVVPMRGFVLSAAADGTLIVWDYTTFEDESAFDAHGKIVFRAKVDGCVKCLQCWPECKAMICGTAEGKLLVFDLPPHFFDPPPELTECLS
ncbi:uncharacterized protein IUM83_09151 [Phytophthora cinnamomi]|uniref:uncharacterized protein n=1 Tax=Phytophthora cinnamomi TaxID=4785 RepID=UPI00355A42EF|nr:hypothetical protein IUM83_09151 [Phytophthora cinnamomi]